MLLAGLLIVLAWGTFIESEYNSTVARFVLYGTNWFAALIALLCVNVLCSVLVRFPWKICQLPFLGVHAGLLVLFFGCYQTWQFGEEAQITLPEGSVGRLATKSDKQQLQFRYIGHQVEESPTLEVPFLPGPFNWQDYEYENWFRNEPRYGTSLWYALHLAHRDNGKLRLADKNINVEVLDYLANSTLESVPPLELNIRWNQTETIQSENGDTKQVPRSWETMQLEMRRHGTGLFEVQGANVTMAHGERVSYSFAGTQDELKAFQTGLPKGGENSGFWGELVLYYGGQVYSLNADSVIKLTGNERLPIADSGLRIGEVRFRDRGPILNFTVFSPGGVQESLTLFPDNPEMNIQARKLGVFGSYWLEPQNILKNRDYSNSPTIRRLALPRYDFVQGPDKKLYYRLWSGEKVIASGEIENAASNAKTEISVAEGTPFASFVSVTRFVGQDVPGARIVSLPVTNSNMQRTEQRLKLHVQFDGKEDTFWLRAVTPTVVPLPPEADQIRYLYGKNRTLCVQSDFGKVDLGFAILLKKFDRRIEPGTKMPSHFSSLVDFVEPFNARNLSEAFSPHYTDYRPLPNGGDILISMNRPAYFKGTGQGYRIYQSSYLGPYHPDNAQFFELHDGKIFAWEKKPRETISMSTLSVNSDPGRGWKYAGCLLIIIGTGGFVLRRKK
ncbi:hypothetical protein FACS1894170_01120 [Planctomycetales bacterium]|nr:hypothetical protein FACS1894170_01120 [Planctomycetales bacterium]